MSTAPHIAVFPGSFDPLTSGHVDIIERGRFIFDKVIVSVLINRDKTPLFTTNERVAMIREVFSGHDDVEVDTFDGLLVDYAQGKGARAIIRGLRAVSDFEYEFQMANMNRKLAPKVETVFMMTGEDYFYISSQLVREVAMYGGSVQGLVPPNVLAKMTARFRGA
jgi:pantetheine-phosphate adenylyltransferase